MKNSETLTITTPTDREVVVTRAPDVTSSSLETSRISQDRP